MTAWVGLPGRTLWSLRAPAAVAAAYFLGSLLGLSLRFPGTQISSIWPPNAILLAALLVTPRRRWWTHLLAVLPAHLAAQTLMGIPFPVVLINFAGNVGDALLGALVILQVIPEPRRFDSLRTVAAVMLFGGVLAPTLVSVAVGQLLAWTDLSTDPLLAWRLRLLTNTLAVLTLVPPIVLAATRERGAAALPPPRSGEAGVLLTGLLVVGIFVFELPRAGPQQSPLLLYLPQPFLLWAAVRFGLSGASLSVLTLSGLAMWGTLQGYGPFTAQDPIANATSLVLYLNVTCASLLLLAAALEERQSVEKQRRRVEQEARAQRQELAHLTRVAMLGELSGALAHELNQPLTAILSNAQAGQRLLAREPVDLEEIREILRDIAADDRRAGEIIHRLRAMLKKGDAKPAPLDLNELARKTLGLAHSDLITRNVAVTLELSPGLPLVYGDSVQIQQVLLNLIFNACEAMSANQAGERCLVVMSAPAGKDGVRMSVADHGTGIPPEAIEKVFEPFFTTKEQGLGLGLPICRSLVEAHGGRLWASNNDGGGATFHLTLPLREATAS
ncbi:MAG TPA: MASE1 domain-containing protein [Thermoanaerobaculia bacterium]